MDLQVIIIVIFFSGVSGLAISFSNIYKRNIARIREYLMSNNPAIWDELKKTGEDKKLTLVEMSGNYSVPLYQQRKVLKKLSARHWGDTKLSELCRVAEATVIKYFLLISSFVTLMIILAVTLLS